MRYFHVSEYPFALGDVLTPSASRPDDECAWECLYRDNNAWRAEKVWLFASKFDAASYHPGLPVYEVQAQAERHYVDDCLCGTEEADDCDSLDCDMPVQYIADSATVVAIHPKVPVRLQH